VNKIPLDSFIGARGKTALKYAAVIASTITTQPLMRDHSKNSLL
jgi:hypothetical protein